MSYKIINGKMVKASAARLNSIKPVTVSFIAYRHGVNGKAEIVAATATLDKIGNDRKALLHTVATKVWAHNPPVECIAEYLIGTQSYKMMTQFGNDKAFIINFHERDPQNPMTYSCREIMAIPESGYEDAIKSAVADLQGDDYSVKQYA